MAEFASVLSRVLERPLAYHTEFNGTFDVKLDFLPDDSTAALPPPPPGAPPGASPTIFTALQQMGLRLELSDGPLGVLVIEGVGRPSAN